MPDFHHAHASAEEAIAAPTLGGRTLSSTYAEAFKLAGKPALDIHGRPAWYTTPTGYMGGQDPFSPKGIWHVSVVHDQAANEESIAAARANQVHMLEEPDAPEYGVRIECKPSEGGWQIFDLSADEVAHLDDPVRDHELQAYLVEHDKGIDAGGPFDDQVQKAAQLTLKDGHRRDLVLADSDHHDMTVWIKRTEA